jgi:hypothetical protein
MRIFRESVLATIFVALSACGGPPTEPATPPPPPAPSAEAPAASAAPPASEAPTPTEPKAAEEPAAPAPAHDVWKDGMSKDEQVAFMKKNVVPEMEPVFKGADATRYANFGCKTCHGPKFKDPKEFLPKLTFSKEGKMLAPTGEKAMKVAEFMGKEVVPHMATALGLAPYDMATGKGFGCHGCHEVKMK